MKYEDYIRSTKPIKYSLIGLAVALLLPISILVFEGWHSGVPWALFFAFQMAVLIPGIYLLRPAILYLWMVLGIIGVSACHYIMYQYWSSVSDWMDVDIPPNVMQRIHISIWLVLGSSSVLGSLGWVNYFRKKRKAHNQRPDFTARRLAEKSA